MKILDKKGPLTAERLKEFLQYDPETGVFTCRVQRGNRKAGGLAGGLDRLGYQRLKVEGRTYQGSRLAWLYTFGTWPKECIDHANGVRSDDRLGNLRECSVGENNQNLGVAKNNKSGVTGVGWKSKNKKWCVQIKHLGVVRHVGLYSDLSKASEARAAAKALLHVFQGVDPTRSSFQGASA